MASSRRDFLRNMLAAPLANVPRKFLKTSSFFGNGDPKSRFAADPLRPQFHLLPAKNWMNDPNGPIFWKGLYHMFFQYNPNAAVWGDMHWAHAVSHDMIHWKHLPVALAPTPGWADEDGCFTGSAVDDRGTATIVYTGVKKSAPELATLRDGKQNLREVQCLATSTDPQLREWTKYKMPILEPPADPMLTGFRDPFLWRDRDIWYLGVGSGVRRQGGRVLLYRSKDLRQWEYTHALASGTWSGQENVNPVDSGEMWECPDFFAIDSKHVLLYSTAGKVLWETGELDPKELVFHSERSGVLDHGAYYAQKTQLDVQGNRILWGWIPETRPETEFSAAGWAGCMALPRVLSLNQENDLEMRVAPQAESLHENKLVTFASQAGRGGTFDMVRAVAIKNLAGELRWRVGNGPSSLTLADANGPWWRLKITGSGSGVSMQINDKTIQLPRPAKSEMEFNLYLDASVSELFCNDLHVITSRIYRPPCGPLHIEIEKSSLDSLRAFEAWQLRPISPNRLTS